MELFEQYNWAVGFSGITSCLFGFGMFLLLWWFAVVMLREMTPVNMAKTAAGLLLMSLMIGILPLWVMLIEIGGRVNVFAHMMGYSFGLFVPVVIGMRNIVSRRICTDSDDKNGC